DPDGKPMSLGHPVPEVEVRKRDVHRAESPARRLVDLRREPEAERGDAVVAGAKLFDRRVQLAEQRLLRGDVGRPLEPRFDRSLVRHDRRQRLRPADVDAYDPERLHLGWLPYAAGWRRPAERSRIASTAVGVSRAGCPQPRLRSSLL